MLRRNVLIFHQAALGDFILTWPLAVALGRLYPQSRIAYVTSSSKGKLAERVLGVDARDAETGWSGLFVAGAQPTEGVAKALAGTHAIFDFIAGAESEWTANMKRLAPHAELTHLPSRPGAGYDRHATDGLLESLAQRPAVRAAVEQILRSVRDRGIATRRTVGDAIVIHPGSGSPTKNWPLDSYSELARSLKTAGRSVRFIIGEVERERWSEGDLARLRGIADLRTPVDYLELHRDLIDAAVYIGNDSGPSHLAAICGVPTIAIFIASDPRVWSPIGPTVKILEASSANVAKVVELVGQLAKSVEAPTKSPDADD